MSASFFEGASNIHVSGDTRFTNVVAGRDVHQVDNWGDTYNTNSNNKTSTVIKDSFNNNSRHIAGSGARNHPLARGSGRDDEFFEDDSSGWTEESTTDSSEEEYVDDRRNTRRKKPGHQRKSNGRSAKTGARTRPAASDQEFHSESDVHTSIPPAGFTSPECSETRPAPTHTVSAPAAPTQAVSTPSTLSPSLRADLHLAVPQLHSANTSSASLTQSLATPTVSTQTTPGLYRPSSAPNQSTLTSLVGSSLTAPSVQPPSSSVGRIDLSARYRYLVTRERDEIRRMLVNIAQSAPKDKFFMLKDQAMRADGILGLVEGSSEKIQRRKEVVQLALESHAVAFIAIMAAEKKTPDAKRVYNLLKILDDVEELMVNIVQKEGLSKWKPFKREENKKLMKSYRKRLETWLKDFQSDAGVTIDFALHQASNALAEALHAEQQYAIVVQAPSQGVSSASPPASQMQTPVPSPGSTSVSNVGQSALSMGSGSAAVINGEGSGDRVIHQNSHNNNSRNFYDYRK